MGSITSIRNHKPLMHCNQCVECGISLFPNERRMLFGRTFCEDCMKVCHSGKYAERTDRQAFAFQRMFGKAV